MNKNTPEYRAMMKQAIEALRVNDPQKFAELQKRAKNDSYDAQVRAREAREEQEAYEREKFSRFNKPFSLAEIVREVRR